MQGLTALPAELGRQPAFGSLRLRQKLAMRDSSSQGGALDHEGGPALRGRPPLQGPLTALPLGRSRPCLRERKNPDA